MPSYLSYQKGRGSNKDYLSSTARGRARRMGYVVGGAIKLPSFPNPLGMAAKVAGTIANTLTSGRIATRIKNRIPATDATARKAWPGEKHAILKTKKWTGIANYMGPGTNIIKRIENDDPPRTNSDKVAQAHDIRYTLFPEKGRDADQKMIKALKRIQREKTDSAINVHMGMQPIKAKMKLEDMGIMSKDKFTKPGSTNLTPAQRAMMTKKLNELAQQGYGMKDKKSLPGQKLLNRLEHIEKQGKGFLSPVPGPQGKGVSMPGPHGRGVSMPGPNGMGISMPGPKGKGYRKAPKSIRQMKGRGMHGGALAEAIPVMARKIGLDAATTRGLKTAVKDAAKGNLTLHQATKRVGDAIGPIILAKAKERLKISKKIPVSLQKKVASHVSKGLKRVVLGQSGSGWGDLTKELQSGLKDLIKRNKGKIVKTVLDRAPTSVLNAAKSIGVDPAMVTDKIIAKAADAL